MLTNLTWEAGGPVAPFTTAALQSEAIVLAAADRLLLVHRRGSPSTGRVEQTLRLSFVADHVALSPTGRFLLAGDRVRLEVWDLREGRRVLDFWAREPRRSGIVGTIARHEGRELLVWNDAGSDLHGYDLDARAAAFSCHAETFRLAVAPLILGSHLVVLGHFEGESKDSLIGVGLGQLLSAPESVPEHFRQKRGIQDYAYRLCAGPASTDSFVVFRDPEDDEDDPSEEGHPQSYDDVRGLRGLYVRRVAGELVERLPWNGPVESFAPLSSSPGRIVAACTDGIHLLSHTGEETSPPIDARWLATSPDGTEVLVQTPDGTLALL
jgi:hypothetical protein